MLTLLHPPLPDAAVRHWRWRGLHGSARALALAEAVAADTRPWVFIAADTREAEQLAAELHFFAGDALEILTLPDWEVLPYDIFSPHPDIVSERLRTLSRLPGLRRGVLLLAVDSLLTRLPPVPYVQALSFELRRGEPLAIEPLRLRLAQSGYASVSQVSSPGEFALRGSLFDVFPMGAPAPVRVDLLDEHIDTIRHFDPESQRSLQAIQQLRLLPARELPLDAESVRAFRRRYRARFEGDITRMSVYRGVSEGIAPPGIEFYLPLFFDATAMISDYLPDDAIIQQIHPHRRRRAHGEHIEQRAAQREFTGAADLADAGVAGLRQAQPQGLDRQRLTAPQLEAAGLYIGHRWQARKQAVDRQQQDAAA